MKALHYFSDDAGNDGDKTYVRIGFKGATQINDMLTGYGQWEYQIAANHSESDGTKDTKTRLGFAGLKYKDFGSFDYGRNYGIIYDVGARTDMLPEFGDDAYVKTDNFMNGRTNGVATYRNNNFFGLVDGLKFAVQYRGKNENDGRSASKANGDGWGLSSSYEIIDGLSVGAAYASSNRTASQKAGTFGKGDKADIWAAGMKYDNNDVYRLPPTRKAATSRLFPAPPPSITVPPPSAASPIKRKAGAGCAISVRFRSAPIAGLRSAERQRY